MIGKYTEKKSTDFCFTRLKIQGDILSKYEKQYWKKFLKSFNDKISILELGCADGSYIKQIIEPEKIKFYLGLDCNENIIEEAQKTNKNINFKFFKYDVDNEDEKTLNDIILKTPEKQFDIIYISKVLLHLTKPKEAIVKLSKYLKPNGKFIVMDIDDNLLHLAPDSKHLLKKWKRMKALSQCNRTSGQLVPTYFIEAGHDNITTYWPVLDSNKMKKRDKKDLALLFTNVIIKDLESLVLLHPENKNIKRNLIFARKNQTEFVKMWQQKYSFWTYYFVLFEIKNKE